MIKLILYLWFIVNSVGLIFSIYSISMGEELFGLIAVGLFFSLVINYELIQIVNNVQMLIKENKRLSKQVDKINEKLSNVLEIK